MSGDGARAWYYLQCDPEYRAAWREAVAPPAWEDAPFRIRLQSEADLAALGPWRMLAWEDPFGGAASAFFADAPMLDGAGSQRAPPLLPLLRKAGAAVEGLRLRGGGLVLKVEKDGAAVQVRVTEDRVLLAGGGVRLWHDWGLRLPVEIARLTDLWSVSGGPAPGRGIGGRDRKVTATRSS